MKSDMGQARQIVRKNGRFSGRRQSRQTQLG